MLASDRGVRSKEFNSFKKFKSFQNVLNGLNGLNVLNQDCLLQDCTLLPACSV